MPKPINLSEYEVAARKRLPRMVYDYYAGGSDDELTLGENLTAWNRFRLVPRVLVNVSDIDTSTTLFGRRMAFPVLTAPCAFNRLAHEDGEKAVARATAAAGIIQVLSTASTTTLEEVAQAAPGGGRWFQLYCYKDRSLTLDLVQRAQDTGYEALCLTVDVPVASNRERDIRNGFHLPPGITWANVGHLMGPDADGSALTSVIHANWERRLTWETVSWLQAETTLPVLIKGVMASEDARIGAESGVAGVVISNHGGRQLDGAASTAEVLAEAAAAVDGRCPILVDGGIRRGGHILKALALGADAVLVGRPYLWGLAVDGEAGVQAVLEFLKTGLEEAMALTGCRSVADCRGVQIIHNQS